VRCERAVAALVGAQAGHWQKGLGAEGAEPAVREEKRGRGGVLTAAVSALPGGGEELLEGRGRGGGGVSVVFVVFVSVKDFQEGRDLLELDSDRGRAAQEEVDGLPGSAGEGPRGTSSGGGSGSGGGGASRGSRSRSEEEVESAAERR